MKQVKGLHEVIMNEFCILLPSYLCQGKQGSTRKEMMKEWWSWSASVVVQHPLVILLFLLLAMKALHVLWLKPKKLEQLFWRQGMRGPPRCLVIGNVGEMVAMVLAASSMPVRSSSYHNILPRVLPFLHQWKKAYGSIFLMWFGPTPRVVVAEPELIREVLVTRVQLFDRYVAHPFVRQLEGEGLVNLRGAKWALHRKLISPVFKSDNLRLVMPTVGEKVVAMVEKLLTVAGRSSGEVEVDVAEWYQSITEDVITRVTFGRSYADGKAVFNLQARLMVLAAEAFNRVFVPGYRYLPTKKNRERWKLDVDIRQNLAMLVSRRREIAGKDEAEKGASLGAKDLLGQMTASCGPAAVINSSDVVEECKTFFFAGKQTITNLLTWTTLLLAMHPEWQHIAREELLHVCGSRDLPFPDDLHKLKTLGMVVNETLRLYPPAVAILRRAKADVQLGRYTIPRGTEILIPILAVHHDESLWGAEAHRFDPARFSQGLSRAARHPNAFIPWGLGERTCVGRDLAIVEAKLALAAVLSRFEISLSPNYTHAPMVTMLLYPKHGAPLIFKPITKIEEK